MENDATEKTTKKLNALAKKSQKEGRISYGEIISTFGAQGYGILIILFALPSALPISVIPGFSFIFGLPILFIACHLIIGKPYLWLPRILKNKTIEGSQLTFIINKCLPTLRWIESWLKPRWNFFFASLMQRFLGLVLFMLGVLLTLPIPFSNFIFAGLLICFGLGLVERDGVFVVIGYCGALLSQMMLIKLGTILWRWFF